MAFTNARYILPAEASILSILSAGPKVNVYDFEHPRQRKTPRALEISPEAKQAPQKRAKVQQCKNKQNAKRLN